MAEATNSYESLAPYYQAARAEAEEREQITPIDELDVSLDPPVGFVEAIDTNPDVAVIAEHKRRSPSAGDIRPDSDIIWTVEQYRKGGATAVSILTEGEHFGGRIGDIAEADTFGLPMLRKDFISNKYQIHEAKYYGAAAVLLIVGGLSDPELKRLYNEAGDIGLDALVEVHDEAELERALAIEPALVGVNNRNLSDPKDVNLEVARELIPQIPDGIIKIAESGYQLRDEDGVFTLEHIMELRRLGADGVLMGTALMDETNPSIALLNWLFRE